MAEEIVKNSENTETKKAEALEQSEETVSKEELEQLLSQIENEADEEVEEEEEEKAEEVSKEDEEEIEEEVEEEEEKSLPEEIYVEAEDLLKSVIDEFDSRNSEISKKIDVIKSMLEGREKLDRTIAKTFKLLAQAIEKLNEKIDRPAEPVKKSVSEQQSNSNTVNPETIKATLLDLAMKNEITPQDVIAYEVSGKIPEKIKNKINLQ